MTEREILEKLISLLGSEPSVKDRYSSTIEILRVQLEQAKKDRYRIGVIGVTSSGKSTMINALLGEKLLCMDVRPSSNQLVTCSKAPERQVKIYFENDKELVIKGAQMTPSVVGKYSDETQNVHNAEAVKQLELSTPGFAFDDDILLVDSPGLDAYQMENHERLTMNNLLPTIDFCIFVTTLKTQSDQKMLDVLNAVAEKGCPVIVVQNMLDSVKPSADGKKSVEMVAQEHRTRAERIVNNSNIADKNSVRIVQISSIQALEGRIAHDEPKLVKSNYYKLISAVSQTLAEVRPRIEANRMASIKSIIQRLVSEAESDISSSDNSTIEKFRFEGYDKQIKCGYEIIQNSLNHEIMKLMEIADFISKHKAMNNNPLDWILAMKREQVNTQIFSGLLGVVESEMKTLSRLVWGENEFREQNVDDVKKRVKKCEDGLLRMMREYSKSISKLCTELGVDERRLKALDSFGSLPELRSHQRPDRVRVEKTSGPFGGNVARWFGDIFGTDWGYEYKTVMVYDAEATRKSALEYLKSAVRLYTDSCERWLNTAKKERDVLLTQIELSFGEYKERREKALDRQKQQEIMRALNGICSQIPVYNADKSKKVEHGSTDLNLELTEMEVPESAYSFYQLADKIKLTIHETVFSQAFPGNKGRTYLVISWDAASGARFLKYSFGMIVSDEEASGMIRKENVIYIFAPDDSKLESQRLYDQSVDCFCLFNALQYGAAMKAIQDSHICDVINRFHSVNWVIQDLDEIRNAGEGSVRDSIRNMLRIRQEFGILPAGSIMISDENPVYQLAAIQIQQHTTLTHTDEISLLNDLNSAFPFFMKKGTDRTINEIYTALQEGRKEDGKKQIR